ncbi:MAG: OmpH family outer membrane protein [Bacteroidia bacterium]|nr:MAG: OmpH family outer membrane protein [Bacteroidia bacterium]
MKKLLNFSLLLLIILGSTQLHAQGNYKFGHINTNELLRLMPGREQAMADLERYTRELEETFVAMQQEFQTKYQDYLENQENFSQLVRQSRERELQSLNERIMEFQESAQEDLLAQEERLLSPIIEKARNAIQKVGREHGFTYIFDTSGGSMVFWENGEDIMPLVKVELGL